MLLMLTAASAASGHGAQLSFTDPEGVGNAPDGGSFVVRWSGYDLTGTTQLELYATREPISNWTRATDTLRINPETLYLADAGFQYAWDTSGLPPGCYQPYALLIDELDGALYTASAGRVTIPGATVPPAVWITNERGDKVDAAGRFVIRYRVVDPDSAGTVTLSWRENGTFRPLSAALPYPAGTTDAEYVFDVQGIPNGLYELSAQAESAGEPTCQTLWPAVLWIPGGPYADGGTAPADGGVQPGSPDAGAQGDGGGAPVDPKEPSGCSAAGTSMALWMIALSAVFLLGRARRRRILACAAILLVGAGCAPADPCADPTYEGTASDEAWLAVQDAEGRVQSDPANDSTFIEPAAGAELPAQPPPAFSWTAPLIASTRQAPAERRVAARGFRMLDVVEWILPVAHAHLPPVTGAMYVVDLQDAAGRCLARTITTLSSWTPTAAQWAEVAQGSGARGAQVTSVYLEKNLITEGPFRAPQPHPFSVK